MRRLLVGLVAALSFVLIPIAGPSQAEPVTRAHQADKAGDPNYHKPVVGECRDMTIADIYPHSNTTDRKSVV